MTSYEKTLHAAVELLDSLYAQMNIGVFDAFEADVYWAIAEAYQVEIKQVREDVEDFQWMLTETED